MPNSRSKKAPKRAMAARSPATSPATSPAASAVTGTATRAARQDAPQVLAITHSSAPLTQAPTQSSHDALLHHAQLLFAQQGFEQTTIRQIVAAASANLAAVNYHFGDKKGLYLAVVRQGFQEMLAKQRDAFGPPPLHLPPRDRLAWFIRGMVERAIGAHHSQPMFQILMREMITPTFVLDEFVANFIRPQHDFLRSTLADLTNRPPNDPILKSAVYSVVSQVLFYKHCAAVIERLNPVAVDTPAGREQLASYLTSFCLAGLASIKQPAPLDFAPRSTPHASESPS